MNRMTAAFTAALLLGAPAFAQTGGQKDAQPSGSTQPARLADQDMSFLKQAAEANVSALKLGQLAVEKASNPAVKQLAQSLVDGHGKAEKALAQIAQQDQVIAPEHVTKDAAGTYDDLLTKKGKDFDTAFLDAVISTRESDVKAFEKEADSGKDNELAKYAQDQLPLLRGDLRTARDIRTRDIRNSKSGA
jgi:putative membrane protein